MTKIDQIAQAFAQGVKFAENMKLAMDAAKGKDDEDGHWVTIGEGEEARPVFIKGAKKKAAKTESKKAESKPAQQRNEESPREMALRINREQTARANRSQEDIEAAHQLSLKVDRSFMRELMRVQDNAWSLNQRIKDARSMSMPGADTRNAMSIRNSLRQIQDNISAFDKTMGKIQGQISTAAKDGKIGEGKVNAELRHYRKYCNTFDDYLTRTDNQMANLSKMTNDGHREDREVLSKIANLTSEMAKSATDWRESLENKAHEQNAERTTSQSQPRAQRSTSGEAQTVKALEDAYNVSADLIDEMTPKQADRPFLSRLDSLHKKAVALAKSTPEINNSQELREMTRIMKQADKLVKALPSYYDRNYYGGWVQNLMGKVRAAEEAYTKLIIKASLKKNKTRGPNAAI